MAERASFLVKVPGRLSQRQLAEKRDETPELKGAAQADPAAVPVAEAAEATGGTVIKQ